VAARLGRVALVVVLAVGLGLQLRLDRLPGAGCRGPEARPALNRALAEPRRSRRVAALPSRAIGPRARRPTRHQERSRSTGLERACSIAAARSAWTPLAPRYLSFESSTFGAVARRRAYDEETCSPSMLATRHARPPLAFLLLPRSWSPAAWSSGQAPTEPRAAAGLHAHLG